MANSELIRKIYRDFAAGDAVAVLDSFAADVEFRLAEGHPYRGQDGAWIGKRAIAEKFFAVSGPEWRDWSISVERMLDAGDAVVVEGRYAGIYKPTGNRMDVQVCHVWGFRDGQIASFHQYVDTHRLRGVMGRA